VRRTPDAPDPARASALRAAAARLLNRDAPESYLREWTAHVAAEKTVADVGTTSVVIFRVGTEWLALPSQIFQEVLGQCVVRRMPHHRSHILSGLVNVRGELLLCVALGRLLGLEDAAERPRAEARTARTRLLTCDRRGDRLAFLVDEVDGVHRYRPKDLHEIPATLAKAAAGTYLVGILPWKDRTVGCLDDELVFFALNRGLA
jgi:chemotaxis-related protein WspD